MADGDANFIDFYIILKLVFLEMLACMITMHILCDLSLTHSIG